MAEETKGNPLFFKGSARMQLVEILLCLIIIIGLGLLAALSYWMLLSYGLLNQSTGS